MIRFTVPQRALAHPRLLRYMAAALILGCPTGSFMGRTRTPSHELSSRCFKIRSLRHGPIIGLVWSSVNSDPEVCAQVTDRYQRSSLSLEELYYAVL